MPCGWVLLWHMLSQCLKAGRCHGLKPKVPVDLMEHTPIPYGWARLLVLVYHGLGSPNALRLGAAVARAVPMP